MLSLREKEIMQWQKKKRTPQKEATYTKDFPSIKMRPNR